MNMVLFAAVGALASTWKVDISSELKPVKSANVSFVDSPVGTAVEVPTNGWYEIDVPEGAIGAEEGTVTVWFRQNWTPWGGNTFRDRDKDANGNWPTRLHCGHYARNLVVCGDVRLSAGVYAGAGICGIFFESPWIGRIHAGEWHQLVLAYRAGGETWLYLDGMPFVDKTARKKVAAKIGKTMKIGCSGPHPGLDGAIGGISFSTKAATAEEVAASYAKVVRFHTELLDVAVPVGKKTSVRFRTRDLRTNELTEYVREVTAEKAGPFTMTENGEVFELMALEEEKVKVKGEGEQRNRLLCEFDCTKEYSDDVYNDCGTHVVTNRAGLVYRECDVNLTGCGFTYRVKIPELGRAYRVEIDYPDDARREYSIGTYYYAGNRLHAGTIDCAGILTGVDYPLTGTLQTKNFIFWADTEDVVIGVLGFRPWRGAHPPAAAKIRLYRELQVEGGRRKDEQRTDDNSTVQPSTFNLQPSRRTVGNWDEDPTMDAQLAFSHGHNFRTGDLEYWRIKWERVIAYMRWMGMNSWDIKTVSYYGDVMSMPATMGEVSRIMGISYRCPGWDALGAAMLEKAGMDIWTRFNNKSLRHGGWFARLGGLKDPAALEVLDKNGRPCTFFGTFRFYAPESVAALKRLVAAHRDRFGVYPRYRGITLNEHPAIGFMSGSDGYDDRTVADFARETGVAVPMTDCAERYRYLTGEKRKEWLDWRCAKTVEVLRELVKELRANGHDGLELQYWVAGIVMRVHEETWPKYDVNETLREAGVDAKAIAAIDGVRFVPTSRPDLVQHWNRLEWNEPYLIFSPEWANAWREAGVDAFNVFGHSTLEIYPSLAPKDNRWKHPFPWPVGANVAGIANFYNYAPAHPNTKHALEPFVHVLAELDVQDLMYGWWGLPESGEMDAFRAFYHSYVRIPRGRFDLLEGFANDPVAIRVSKEGKGWYAVNRESYPVKVAGLTLGPCEVSYSAGAFPFDAATLKVEIASESLTPLKAQIAKMKAILAANPSLAELKRQLGLVDAAMAAGRYSAVRALLLTATARSARLANPVAVSPCFLRETQEIELRIRNFDAKTFEGRLWVAAVPQGWTNGNAVVELKVPTGEERVVRLPVAGPTDRPLQSWERFRVVLEADGVEESLTYAFPPVDTGVWQEKGWPKLTAWVASAWQLQAQGDRGKEVRRRLRAHHGEKAEVTCWYTLLRAPDGSGLRFCADVKDPEFVPPETEGHMYTADSVQIYFDQRNNARCGQGSGYDEDDVVFQIGLLNGTTPRLFREYPKREPIPDAQVRVWHKDGHTYYDAFIPKSELPFADLSAGRVIGFGILVNQLMRDAAGTYNANIGTPNPYLNPSNWYDAYLK